mgnify:FL=1|jgi:hypothetical protein|tara:strand:- start:1888 stop:2136 length:249 start_codon:yes stop_codon:yes gene_type:complete
MEMLSLKTAFGGLIGTVTAAFFLWTASTLVEVDKRTAITEVKVRENNKMIKPLWEDFIRRNANGHVENFDEQTNYKVRIKWK